MTVILDKLEQVYAAETSDDCLNHCNNLFTHIKEQGIRELYVGNVVNKFLSSARNKKSGIERETAMLGMYSMCRVLESACVPHVLDEMVPVMLDLYADKGQVVRDAAKMALTELIKQVHPLAVKDVLLPVVYNYIPNAKKWQSKVGALEVLSFGVEQSPSQIAECLPGLIPIVSECLRDIIPQVVDASTHVISQLGLLIGNEDLIGVMPAITACLASAEKEDACIKALASTTFVREVTGPVLAFLVPILTHALKNRSSVVTRQVLLIITNLCKLVRNPADAAQFLPQLMPGVLLLCENAAFEEIRTLADEAKATMVKVGVSQVPSLDDLWKQNDQKAKERIIKVANSVNPLMSSNELFLKSVKYLSCVCAELELKEKINEPSWMQVLLPIIQGFLPDQAQEIAATVFRFYAEEMEAKKVIATDDEGVELCNCRFSLAYGSRMLLNDTHLRLFRGQRYGLCGKNGAGKTTLMRAIAQGKVEGFPSQDQVKAVFVEHRLQGEETEMTVLEFTNKDFNDEKTVKGQLVEFGFTDRLLATPVGALSGGWKMKLELARAILQRADLLLLDEPTNHLDEAHVKWLVDYLLSQKQITCLIVSHDSGFLDNVCTGIIHYEQHKLVNYKGNLSHFVSLRPEAKTYYTLSDSAVAFSFPQPSLLLGVKSATRSILKVTNASYTYPGAPAPSLHSASVNISLSSRVGIIGRNGAGKSTLVKVMTGEVFPSSGQVWKHPNLRIGYVAQHAFHHLDQHKEETPAAYLRWRYRSGEDMEVLEKATRKLTDQDKTLLATPVKASTGESRFFEMICGRQKLKKTYQYEVKWNGKPHKENSWISRDRLIELGFSKFVQAFDDHEASREGLSYRELNPSVIRQHFADVGLDPDIAVNNAISGLSGGQKVKVVIAAAMWNNPHLLVLDEPTNFLDRDSLGGLAVAIRDWQGAVVLISHSSEFLNALCPEIWHVDNGVVTIKGKQELSLNNFEDEVKIDDSKLQRRKKKKTRNELKEQAVRRRQRELKWLCEGGEREPDTDSD